MPHPIRQAAGMTMIDFSDYDTRQKSNEGAPFHPTPPGFTEPLTEVTFWVRGVQSEAVRKMKIDKARQALARKKTGKQEDLTDDELIAMVEGDPEAVAALVVTWEGVGFQGETLDPTDENKVMLMRDWPWLRTQIDTFAARIENFLPDASSRGRTE